ncbi:MAG TPA: hypothetical protein VFG25_05070 [Nitrosopumilaceae archaeon]|nr:hypothetical protein [Nitrosopumilaceae archaeon]
MKLFCTLGLKRITIMLDEDLLKKLRKIQAKEITKSQNTVSLSKVINETLAKRV